jgi:hypothetical protein
MKTADKLKSVYDGPIQVAPSPAAAPSRRHAASRCAEYTVQYLLQIRSQKVKK